LPSSLRSHMGVTTTKLTRLRRLWPGSISESGSWGPSLSVSVPSYFPCAIHIGKPFQIMERLSSSIGKSKLAHEAYLSDFRDKELQSGQGHRRPVGESLESLSDRSRPTGSGPERWPSRGRCTTYQGRFSALWPRSLAGRPDYRSLVISISLTVRDTKARPAASLGELVQGAVEVLFAAEDQAASSRKIWKRECLKMKSRGRKTRPLPL
jgi:hypothetical protein